MINTPSWVSVTITLFYMAWLIAVLVFLYVIWRTGARHAQRLETTLIDAMLATAEAAQKAAEAAHVMACYQQQQQQQQHTITVQGVIDGPPYQEHQQKGEEEHPLP